MPLAKAIQILLTQNNWPKQSTDFLNLEHLETFIHRLEYLAKNGVEKALPPPYFSEEITPLIAGEYPVLKTLDFSAESICQFILNTPLEHLLLFMGQRLTPASVQNHTAIPPLKQTILKSCFEPYNSQISKATRAWEKHTNRSSDQFWGTVSGNPIEKENHVKHLINECLKQFTWWNIFYHNKHELVYEIRVPSGHGLRWSSDGKNFIGFLEPFL